jgi:hypothetical protein
MSDKAVIDRMRTYAKDSVFSDIGLCSMIGIKQSVFSRIVAGNYQYGTGAYAMRFEKFFDELSEELELISKQLKMISTANYNEVPDSIIIKRMRLHSRRSELMNLKETRMRTSNHSTSLQKAV